MHEVMTQILFLVFLVLIIKQNIAIARAQAVPARASDNRWCLNLGGLFYMYMCVCTLSYMYMYMYVSLDNTYMYIVHNNY